MRMMGARRVDRTEVEGEVDGCKLGEESYVGLVAEGCVER